MSAADRPWWATEDVDPRPVDADPLEAHRAARRGRVDDEPEAGERTPPPAGDPPDDDGSWWVPATEAVVRLARDLTASAFASPPPGLVDDDGATHGAEDRTGGRHEARGGDGGGGHHIDACGVCPICVGLRALGDARPDLVGHLAEAARQLALAVRTVVDATAPQDEAAGASGAARGSGGRRRPPDDLQRIDLDD